MARLASTQDSRSCTRIRLHHYISRLRRWSKRTIQTNETFRRHAGVQRTRHAAARGRAFEIIVESDRQPSAAPLLIESPCNGRRLWS